MSRRRDPCERRDPTLVKCVAVVLAVLASATVWGEDLEVPARIQAELIGKLASYDRTFAERAGANAVLAILVNPGNAGSARAISQLAAALKELLLHRRSASRGGRGAVEGGGQPHRGVHESE